MRLARALLVLALVVGCEKKPAPSEPPAAPAASPEPVAAADAKTESAPPAPDIVDPWPSFSPIGTTTTLAEIHADIRRAERAWRKECPEATSYDECASGESSDVSDSERFVLVTTTSVTHLNGGDYGAETSQEVKVYRRRKVLSRVASLLGDSAMYSGTNVVSIPSFIACGEHRTQYTYDAVDLLGKRESEFLELPEGTVAFRVPEPNGKRLELRFVDPESTLCSSGQLASHTEIYTLTCGGASEKKKGKTKGKTAPCVLSAVAGTRSETTCRASTACDTPELDKLDSSTKALDGTLEAAHIGDELPLEALDPLLSYLGALEKRRCGAKELLDCRQSWSSSVEQRGDFIALHMQGVLSERGGAFGGVTTNFVVVYRVRTIFEEVGSYAGNVSQLTDTLLLNEDSRSGLCMSEIKALRFIDLPSGKTVLDHPLEHATLVRREASAGDGEIARFAVVFEVPATDVKADDYCPTSWQDTYTETFALKCTEDAASCILTSVATSEKTRECPETCD